MTALVEVDGLVRRFPGPRGGWLGARRDAVVAVAGVSLRVERGVAYGLVGESGSGKSTLARVVAGLLAPTQGEVRIDGRPVRPTSQDERRRLWRCVQYVHQNPRAALNPRLRVSRILGGPLESLLGLRGGERDARVARALERVGLAPAMGARHPHAFSGGQAQRVAIARALIAEPELLLLDEPTSALDVRVQADVLRLLARLRDELGTTLLFISHDLPVVGALCSRIGVLREGRLVEEGAREKIFERPEHPYTRQLLESVPRLPPRRDS